MCIKRIFNWYICFYFHSPRQVGIRRSCFGKRSCGANPAERGFRHRQSGTIRLPGSTHKAQDFVGPIVQCSSARRSVSRTQRIWMDT